MPNMVKPFLSIEEQIAHLKTKGMLIEDGDEAAAVLQKVSYYRLINAYALDKFVDSDKLQFKPGISFRQIYDLYVFDNALRHQVSALLETFEISFRTHLAYYIGEHYGALGYENPLIFQNAGYFNEMKDAIARERKTQSKSPIVKHHDAKYGGSLPVWALVEVLSFGTLSKVYKNLQVIDQKAIAKGFGVSYKYLNSWLRALVEVRNICAHYGRLYNKHLIFPPMLFKDAAFSNTHVFAVLFILHRYAEPCCRAEAVAELAGIIAAHPAVDLACIGFPEDWEQVLSH